VITILAVAASPEGFGEALARHPSIEIVTATGPEDAVEKLARNRRIDAVLLLGDDAAAAAAAIREEDPAAPPLYAPSRAGTIPGVRPLPDESPEALAEAVGRLLEA